MSGSSGCKENTDVEIWREEEGNYYSPSIHKTIDNNIGINVGGLVFVKSAQDWHELAKREAVREDEKQDYVPYQGCPICDGAGRVIADGFTSSVYQTCTVCSGHKIIPMHVLPKLTKENQ